MSQEHEIYKVLLELKESSGSTSAKLDDIKKSIDEQSTKHDKLPRSPTDPSRPYRPPRGTDRKSVV